MYLVDRISQLLRCDVALHFINKKNTWDIYLFSFAKLENNLYTWKHKKKISQGDHYSLTNYSGSHVYNNNNNNNNKNKKTIYNFCRFKKHLI